MRRTEVILNAAGALLVAVLMILTVLDVLGRNILNRPLPGAMELTEVALVALCFLMFPLAALRNKHIVADLFENVRSKKVILLQRTLAASLGAAVFGVLTWRLWVLAQRSASYGDVSPVLGIPVEPVFEFAAVLSAMTAVVTLWAATYSSSAATPSEISK